MRSLPLSFAGLLLFLLALACSGTEEGEGSPTPPAEGGAAASLSPAPAGDLPPQGAWTYGESCGENAGGTPVFVGYSVRISGKEVSVDADGYQTMLRAVGTASVNASGVWEVRFERLGEEAMGGTYLHPGDVMLTFTVEDGDLQITPGELIFNCTQTTLFTREG